MKNNGFLSKYGEWAVVTGASSGIGRSLAGQIAQRGIHPVLVGRNSLALRDLAQQIQTPSQVLVADLAKPEGREAVIRATKDLPVGLLVNSAGFGLGGSFLQTSFSEESEMVEVNCQALLELTHHFAARFAKQRRGGMLLLSSIVAFQGVAWSANYAATKAYVQSLAEGLAIELAPHGVDVVAVAPGPTSTGFAARAGMDLGKAESASVVAREALDALGRRRQAVTGFQAKFLHAALSTAPRPLRVRIMANVMRSMTEGARPQ
jgi:short-subunit dehydrogenase